MLVLAQGGGIFNEGELTLDRCEVANNRAEISGGGLTNVGNINLSGGSVVANNTASINGLSPGNMQGIYSISKAAVISMTKSFAMECAEFNVRVNALLPGLTKTTVSYTHLTLPTNREV